MISLWLNSARSIKKAFHCSVCGKKVFEYYTDLRMIVSGDASNEMAAPLILQCHGAIDIYENGFKRTKNCGTRYLIA